ncbi:alkaline phosphatase family protein, partial [bacterium]
LYGLLLGICIGIDVSHLNHLFLWAEDHFQIVFISAVTYAVLYAGISVFPAVFFVALSKVYRGKIAPYACALPAALGFFVFSYIFAYAADLKGLERVNPVQNAVYGASFVAGIIVFLAALFVFGRIRPRISAAAYTLLIIILPIIFFIGGRIWYFSAEKSLAKIAKTQKVNIRDTGLKVIFIGMDAGNYEIMKPLFEEGRLPNFKHMKDNGASGLMIPNHPSVSPMLWATILTGKSPAEHSIKDFVYLTVKGFPRLEKFPRNVGVCKILVKLDMVKYFPVSAHLRDEKMIWKILSEQGRTVGAIGWWPSWPAEKVSGYLVSDITYYLGKKGQVKTDDGMTHPPGLLKDFKRLRIEPGNLSAELPDFMNVYSPDEAAELAELAENEPVRFEHFLTVLAKDLSYFRMFEYMYDTHPTDFASLYLKTMDDVGHLFYRYYDPDWEGWWKKPHPDTKPLGDLVNQVYVLHDQWVGEVLKKVDSDTVIILGSDHGMQPSTRDAPYISGGHSEKGIIMMAGGPVKKGFRMPDVSHYEIAPTILYLLGMPVPEDMKGKIMTDALDPEFVERFPPEFVKTYKSHIRDKIEYRKRDTRIENKEMEGLKNLGYIDDG